MGYWSQLNLDGNKELFVPFMQAEEPQDANRSSSRWIKNEKTLQPFRIRQPQGRG